MKQIGAYGFGVSEELNDSDSDSDTDVDDENDEEENATKKSMDTDAYKMMKKNESLMQKFESENRYFKKHPNPPSMISQLKPYQQQALQWMKYREGKIQVEDLFEEQYKDDIKDFQFERKLSPFWEEVEVLNGEKFYINYLTG